MGARDDQDPPDSWAPLVERFVDQHYGSVRRRVRNYVIAQHLRQHLPLPPATIVDIGGGAGNQSIPLAAQGYRVTIVDPSEAMLGRADAWLGQLPPDVAARVRLVRATAEQAEAALDGERFVAVLCHG